MNLQAFTMARHPGAFYKCCYSWKCKLRNAFKIDFFIIVQLILATRNWKANEKKHYALYGASIRDNPPGMKMKVYRRQSNKLFSLLQRISLRVKRRFPGLQHLVDSGLMLESERKIFEIMDSKSPMSKCM